MGFLEQYYIGLGGGGKVFQDVEFWKREALNIELEYHEVLTFGIPDALPEKGTSCRGRGGGI